MYAIVDIETTGGNFKNGHITEIAIYRHDGNMVVDEFVSLVNPECFIPDYITQLTGISNEMVRHAPTFPQIARRILDITSDAVFVAHNASFDFSFLRAEFLNLGYDFNRTTLCTVKMSRKLLPGHASYSLGQLTHSLGITLNNRHRAAGDALATVQLFDVLLQRNGGFFLPDDPYQEFSFELLHPLLTADRLFSLPASSGLFYLYGASGDVLVMGQSSNVRNHVLSILAGKKSKLNIELKRSVTDFSFRIICSKLVLGLVEIVEKQALNLISAKSSKAKRWGIFTYRDQKGYRRLFVGLALGRADALELYASASAAKKMLLQWCDQYQLCQHLCGLSDGKEGCFQYQIRICRGACICEEPACDYNDRVNRLFSELSAGLDSAVVIDQFSVEHESGFVLIEKGTVKGYGKLTADDSFANIDDFKSLMEPVADSPAIRHYIRDYLSKHKVERILRF